MLSGFELYPRWVPLDFPRFFFIDSFVNDTKSPTAKYLPEYLNYWRNPHTGLLHWSHQPFFPVRWRISSACWLRLRQGLYPCKHEGWGHLICVSRAQQIRFVVSKPFFPLQNNRVFFLLIHIHIHIQYSSFEFSCGRKNRSIEDSFLQG